ncbi:hypothetical protein [Methanobrevibacter sp.]|uniref:hypothetical protein n=1 Tax=Methanobrevibacter sp. TaxID=66852 RepID=UPI0025D09C52|nr:hypothetical protein [Methanobrevibacter sp.]MBQ6511073.1 hypothetical protein [Methanobrevibacter sp.]
MKKFALITFSLLILIIGVGIASATDINGTIDDAPIHAIDHQCSVDEIDNTVQNDTNDNSIISVGNDADVNDTIVNSNSSTAAIGNSTQNPLDQKVVPTVGVKNPKHIDLSPENQDSLKKDIAKYNKYFQDNHLKTMSNGKKFSKMDLILEIYKHYSFEDTVIIATHVLRDGGLKISFSEVEAMMYQMIDGSVYTGSKEMNGSYYKDEMHKADELHKSINSESKKYIDLFNKKNGKAFIERPDLHYSYLDLILDVYRNHSSIEETILIATHTLQNCGYNVTAASIEDTVNQMMHASIKTNNSQFTPLQYFLFFTELRVMHEQGLAPEAFGSTGTGFPVQL